MPMYIFANFSYPKFLYSADVGLTNISFKRRLNSLIILEISGPVILLTK